MPQELFASLVRSTGDIAGVFEYDGATGYFYVYRVAGDEDAKVLDALPIVSGEAPFTQADISIRWDNLETKVALFIRNVMWALFDCSSGQKFGGRYETNGSPDIPPNIPFIAPLLQ
ncbi:MAG TPA: DUF2251 domain-containing protein [Stellaceae bacterium]|jgi:hypothetical protein|nr:DUF2251 domain-containing protein [Stellaceae bacterium]